MTTAGRTPRWGVALLSELSFVHENYGGTIKFVAVYRASSRFPSEFHAAGAATIKLF